MGDNDGVHKFLVSLAPHRQHCATTSFLRSQILRVPLTCMQRRHWQWPLTAPPAMNKTDTTEKCHATKWHSPARRGNLCTLLREVVGEYFYDTSLEKKCLLPATPAVEAAEDLAFHLHWTGSGKLLCSTSEEKLVQLKARIWHRGSSLCGTQILKQSEHHIFVFPVIFVSAEWMQGKRQTF